MLTLIEVEVAGEKISLRGISADCAEGDVLLGPPTQYSDQQIRDWADANLAAPQDLNEWGDWEGPPDYQGFEVVR